MNITLKNIIFLSEKQINQLAIITAKPEIMQYIGSGQPYTKSQIFDFIRDERKQIKLSPYVRNYWTYAILNNDDVIGLYALYRKNAAKIQFKKMSMRRSSRSKSTRKASHKSKPKFAQTTIATRRLLDTEYQGKGIGNLIFEIMKNILLNCFFTNDRIPVDIISIANADNMPSNKSLTKLGLEFIGTYIEKDGNIERNVYRWHLVK